MNPYPFASLNHFTVPVAGLTGTGAWPLLRARRGRLRDVALGLALDKVCPLTFESSGGALDISIAAFEISVIQPTPRTPMLSDLIVALGSALMNLCCNAMAFRRRPHLAERTARADIDQRQFAEPYPQRTIASLSRRGSAAPATE